MVAVNASFQYPFQASTATDAQWRGYFMTARTDGVVASSSLNTMAVSQDTGLNMNVKVATGQFVIQGDIGEWSTISTLTVTNNSSGNPRIDTVVVRIVFATPVIQVDIVAGTPAASPSAPTLTRNGTQWELPLANIAVASGATAITNALITDRRLWGSAGAPVRAVSVAGSTALTYGVGTLPNDVILPVSGTNLTITSITVGPAGARLTLVFASYGNLVQNTGTLVLQGDYGSTANGSLTLVSDGTNWVESARSVAQFAGATPPTNALNNGGMEVWQRGTTFNSIANTAYSADRWTINYTSSTGVFNVTQATDSPFNSTTGALNATGIVTPFSLKLAVATADTSLAAGEFCNIEQVIEGPDCRALASGFAISWWVKAHRAGTYCVAFRNNAVNLSYIIEYSVAAVDTWEYKTAVIPFFGSGTWVFTAGGKGMRVCWTIASGTTFGTGTANTWNAGNFLATANQVNGIAATTDTFQITMVNIVPGSTPYPYSPQPHATILARCQRYAQMVADTVNDPLGAGNCISTTQAVIYHPLPVEMGGAPTLTVTTPGSYTTYTAAGTQVLNAISGSVLAKRAVHFLITAAAATLVAGNATNAYQSGAGSILLEWNP